MEGVTQLNLEVIGKLRRDAHLKFLYTGRQKGRGRHRLYDGKVDLHQPESLEFVALVEKDIKLYSSRTAL
ncbi:MAG: transposase [Oscillatoriales cyanobacterium RM2_1_1]|nr:transposase [Oscillatoriales cyanobacterium RM2_1_1]